MKYGEEALQKKLESVNKVGVIILSRFSSSRLPGKALMEIRDKKVLEYIIERVNKSLPLENIIIATSTQKSDDVIEEFGKSKGVIVFRGSLDNVARRFLDASKMLGWDYAIRINGDNIFVDIPLLSSIIEFSRKDNFNFISNVHLRTYPKGMSIESVNVKYFESLIEEIDKSADYREHVTSYLYQAYDSNLFKFIYNTKLIEAQGIQLALDTIDDFERSSKIIENFKREHYYYNLEEIISIIKSIETKNE